MPRQAGPPCSIRCSSTMSRYRPMLSIELVVAAGLGDRTVVKHEDPVGVADRAQPVGDHERGPAPQKLIEALLDQPFAFTIEVAGRFIEDEYLGVGEDGPCDRQPLPLAAAQTNAPLADQACYSDREAGR